MALFNEGDFVLYGHLELLARQAVAGFMTGLHKSPYQGFSVEFAEHRQYNPGESIKHIDWKLYGRTDRLYVKRFEEETNLRCQIVFDNSSSMFFPYDTKKSFLEQSKTNYGLFVAAIIVYILRQQRDAFGLTIFSDKIELHTQCRSTIQHHRFIMNKLTEISEEVNVEKRKATNVSNILHEVAERIHKRSMVVIISDMFEHNDIDELIDALQHLRHNKHEVIVFHIHDKTKEIDFDYENRPYKFIDLETGEKITLNPNEIRNNYKAYVEQMFNQISKKCSMQNIDFVKVDINAKPDQVIKTYITKRKKMI